MSTVAAAGRCIVRSFRLRPASVKLSGEAADAVIINARPSLRCLPKQRPAAAARFLRSPVELSSCVESLLPMHSAIASARMNSKLSVAGGENCGWVPLLHSTMVSIS